MRITKSKLILILLCLVLGIAAAYGETRYVRSVYQEAKYVPVLFAGEDIPVNSSFTAANVEAKDFPEYLAGKDMIRNTDELRGKVAAREIKAGTPLFYGDAVEGRIPVVEEGMVRVTFATSLANSLAGAVHPGDLADIGFVSKDGGEGGLLFREVQIARITNKNGMELKGSQTTDKKDLGTQGDIPATVTVILKTQDAVALKQYEGRGELFLLGF
ncbi:MAG: SAF domain-containing protein [Clostridia bacterium]|nr:SAF domain-containing protein [Clostridia bacterium]